MSRLRAERHVASSEAMRRLGIVVRGTGLVFGHDQSRRPVSVELFRAEPTRVTLVGGLWVARVLAFRALAIGVGAAVSTARPDLWRGFGSWAAGDESQVSVLPAVGVPTGSQAAEAHQQRATAGGRLLRIHDADPLGAPLRVDLQPWQTQLTVVHRLTEREYPVIAQSHLVVLQRLTEEEAGPAAAMLRLQPSALAALQSLPDDMLALLDGGPERYVWTAPTSIERLHFGPPTR